jgi:predicted metal-dependent HD superfamily phosphohydrolase
VRHCLSVYERGPVRDDAVELALWFHDAIYDPQAKDNEERSAAWCVDFARAAGIAPDVVARAERCILATRHRHVPEHDDERLTVAIDLAILGETPERFRAYDRQIRREYAWVPMETYRRERARVLRGFLERPVIYPHPWWERRYGRQARINLRRAIAHCRSQVR